MHFVKTEIFSIKLWRKLTKLYPMAIISSDHKSEIQFFRDHLLCPWILKMIQPPWRACWGPYFNCNCYIFFALRRVKCLFEVHITLLILGPVKPILVYRCTYIIVCKNLFKNKLYNAFTFKSFFFIALIRVREYKKYIPALAK